MHLPNSFNKKMTDIFENERSNTHTHSWIWIEYQHSNINTGGAQVSLNFHTRRERYKWLFQSQIFNKFIYAIIGGTQVIQHFFKRFLASPKELFPRSIALKCDGRRVNLDAYEGIVILNIPYYGGGMNVWRQAMEVTPDSPALRPRTPSEDYMSTKLDSMMLESKNKSSSNST